MEDYEGVFLNVSFVLKSMGGSRNVVKDIFSDLEKCYVQLIFCENFMDSVDVFGKEGDVQFLELYNENFDVGEDEVGIFYILGLKDEDEGEDEEEGMFNILGYGDVENEDEEEDVGEWEEFEFLGVWISGEQEVERESLIFNNGGMIELN